MLLLALAAVTAQLPPLADPALQVVQAREEAAFGGGTSRAARAEVQVTHGELRPLDGGRLAWHLATTGAVLEATPRALHLPPNWREFERLTVVVAADAPLELTLAVLLPRGRLEQAHAVTPGQPLTLQQLLADLPLAAGNEPSYEPIALRFTGRWPDGGTREVVLSSVQLEEREGPAPAVVDPLGQRRNATWPGKLREAGELAQRAAAERDALARIAPPLPRADLDRFGGWKKGPRFAATGFFRVEQDPQARWWLVTPEGHAFWSIGTTGVRVGSVNDTARVPGREALYEALPPADHPAWFSGSHATPLGQLTVPGNVHFYRWNVLRKYGSFENWRDRVIERWLGWGLNTFGSWSDEIMLRQEAVPHTRFLRARAAVPGLPAINGFPDVWDEQWVAAVDAEFARETAVARQDPWLIGYFVDNEAHWREMKLLDIAPGAKLRTAWRAYAEGHYADLARFNADWGTALTSWDQVAQLTMADVPAAPGPARDVLAGFEAAYAERYFSTVARLLKHHDPHHLYLGSRFVRVPPAPAIVAAAGRYVDVLSVNCYSRVPDPEAFADWHRMSGGRPILIGEFHFPLASARQLPPPWQAFPEAEREEMFVEFVRVWAQQPWAVGCHWYQHADQPLLGRHTDGENQTVGIVDITDTPYDHLVRAVRRTTSQMYHWRTAPASATAVSPKTSGP